MTRITKAFQKWNESVNWFAQKDPDLTIFQVQENNVSHWYISRSVIRASWRTQLMNGLSLINQTLFALSSFMLCVCFNIVFKSCNNVKSGKSRRNQSLGNSFHLLCQRRISSSKHRKKRESLNLSNLGNIEQFADSPCQLSTSLNIATTGEDSSLTGMFSFNILIEMCQQFHPGTHVGKLEQPFL